MSTKAEVVVYKGCVSLAILYLTERKRDGNFVDKEVNGESNMWSTGHLKGIDLMLMFGLNEAKNPMAANFLVDFVIVVITSLYS